LVEWSKGENPTYRFLTLVLVVVVVLVLLVAIHNPPQPRMIRWVRGLVGLRPLA